MYIILGYKIFYSYKAKEGTSLFCLSLFYALIFPHYIPLSWNKCIQIQANDDPGHGWTWGEPANLWCISLCHVLTSKTTVAFTVISIHVKMWHLKVSGVAQLMTVKLLQIKCSVLGCTWETFHVVCERILKDKNVFVRGQTFFQVSWGGWWGFPLMFLLAIKDVKCYCYRLKVKLMFSFSFGNVHSFAGWK